MQFTTYKNSVYEDIQKDEILRNFFEKMTLYIEKFYQLEILKQNKENCIKEPTFNKIFEIISKLKEKNIDINSDMKYILERSADTFFRYDLLDGKIRTQKILEFFKEKIKFGFDKYNKMSPSEERHATFEIRNRQLVKKYRKIVKKENSGKKYSKPLLTPEEIWFFHTFEQSEEDVIFIKKLTEEQAKLLIELYEAVCEYKKKYSDYNDKIQKRDDDIQRTETIYEKAFNYMLDVSSTDINIDIITQRLFKILIINKLDDKNFTNEKISFNLASVDWFIKYKSDDLNNLYNQIFDDFSLIITERAEKKKIKGGIN